MERERQKAEKEKERAEAKAKKEEEKEKKKLEKQRKDEEKKYISLANKNNFILHLPDIDTYLFRLEILMVMRSQTLYTSKWFQSINLFCAFVSIENVSVKENKK